jgi:hypothetical protein
MFNHAGIIKMLKWRFALAKNILALLLKPGNRKIKA